MCVRILKTEEKILFSKKNANTSEQQKIIYNNNIIRVMMVFSSLFVLFVFILQHCAPCLT